MAADIFAGAQASATLGASQSAQPEVSKWFFLRYALAYIGTFTALITPVVMTLAVRIEAIDPVNKGANLGIVLGLGALAALIANPLFGMLSDRTTSRFGRRRPWMVGGVLLGLISLLIIAQSSSIAVIALFWCITQGALNAALSALIAVVADQVPEHQRARVSAIAGMSTNIGMLVGTAIVAMVGTGGTAMFLWPTLFGVAMVLLFCLINDDKAVQPAVREKISAAAVLKSFWVNPVKFPDYGWAWLSRFLVFYGTSTLLAYQVYVLIDMFAVAPEAIPGMMLLSTIITAVSVVIFASIAGWYSDRTGKRKIFVFIAAVVFAIGLTVLVSTGTLTGFFIGIAIQAAGFGVYLSIDQALVVDVLPNRETEAAKNLGVMNIANAVPQTLAPAIAPIILMVGGQGNYTLLFIVAAIVTFGGALAILPVKGAK
ncbi:MFS transporter [Ketogulonicigenium vulgare]|uniref:Efflux transporter n=1 Tax=Ketogulonicigenium vulgare (strain WSH-001) TaxID=759362 RepID=F9Y782_KETVW|nr:MFS transporter [Ketogulonicigenium vulgare]ADO41608.1 efflux transporter [Ketogulonicigenium vulgare Y25]AEM39849.1 Efflux transporter [Ketogulonicigenium vulgare WSH-001]ALJ80064.1 transporter [Ketogulonicigenium vulgare]ANW32942.1 transporter [Ketogulonicigenium vulgare]AOZ53538.1 efflux transporter [Ketogulonicigenium vulgare]